MIKDHISVCDIHGLVGCFLFFETGNASSVMSVYIFCPYIFLHGKGSSKML